MTMNDDNKLEPDPLSRRDFIKVGGSGMAGLVVAHAMPGNVQAAATDDSGNAYPVLDVVGLSELEPGAALDFTYPDDDSPAMLLRLHQAVPDGIGPNQDIVAYSTLCTHKGCPVGYQAEHGLLICPCHWSTFDPAKSGALVIGQASQPLPKIQLRIEGGRILASGVDGLIYGRHTNIL